MPSPIISVLVADAQRLFSGALARALALEPDFEMLEQRPVRGVDALEVIFSNRPNVCLIDAWLPDMEGPIVARAIRERAPECKVVLLSWFHSPQHIHQSLNAGAEGFLPKSLELEQVADAIRRVHGGESPVYLTELQGLSDKISDRAVARENAIKLLVTLTPQEIRVLSLLANGFSAHEIAAQLFVTTGTIRVHINKILRKTQTTSQLEAVAFWLGHRTSGSQDPSDS